MFCSRWLKAELLRFQVRSVQERQFHSSSSQNGVDSILEKTNLLAKRKNVESQSEVPSTSELYLSRLHRPYQI